MKIKKFILYDVGIIILLFLIDRITKNYIFKQSQDDPSFSLEIAPFLDLSLVWNKGIAFGLLAFEDGYIYNLISFFIIIIILVVFFLIFKEKQFKKYFLILICGGALGNLYDRFSYGSVIDFIDLNYNNFHWFIFNVADIFITIGVICLILDEILLGKINR